jgi:hypothetical protein
MCACVCVCRNMCDVETLTMRRPDWGCSDREENSITYISQLSNLLIKITYIEDVAARHSITSSACTRRSSQKGTLCRHDSLWALACSTVLFHASLPIAVLLQFWTSFFPDPLWHHPLILTSVCLPILTTTGLHSVTISTVLHLSFSQHARK